jgi:DNA repair protein RadC
VFSVISPDAQHRLDAFEQMFRGTLAQTSEYPREVVKRALVHNCAAVILAHNHPSGSIEPSRADEYLTQTLRTSLAIDVRVQDHFSVGGDATTSVAERGLL